MIRSVLAAQGRQITVEYIFNDWTDVPQHKDFMNSSAALGTVTRHLLESPDLHRGGAVLILHQCLANLARLHHKIHQTVFLHCFSNWFGVGPGKKLDFNQMLKGLSREWEFASNVPMRGMFKRHRHGYELVQYGHSTLKHDLQKSSFPYFLFFSFLTGGGDEEQEGELHLECDSFHKKIHFAFPCCKVCGTV